LAADEQQDLLEETLANSAFGKRTLEETEAAGKLGADPTQPENNSSTILGTVHGADKLLFTADAGVTALEKPRTAMISRIFDGCRSRTMEAVEMSPMTSSPRAPQNRFRLRGW